MAGAEIGPVSAVPYRVRGHSPAIDSGKKIEDNGAKDFLGTAVPQCSAIESGSI